MGVPEEIRKVERPKNTIVCDNGRDSIKRYAVRQRAGNEYVNGHSRPLNGSIIGHIINGKYVPLEKGTLSIEPDMRSFGAAAFADSVSKDIVKDLLEIMDAEDAYRTISIAILRIIMPGISDKRLSTHYMRTFVGIFYRGTHLSRNTVSSFFQKIGMDGRIREKFYKLRLESVMETHHIAIDGTLKTDNSVVNDLSDFSYKGRVKGTKDISIIYAYDIELKEPICASVYPGNELDASAYRNFIEENNIKKGVMITDKGFPPSKIRDTLANRPELHFLTPIKRNDRRIENNHMLDFNGILPGSEGTVLFSKAKIQGGNFLYAFKDMKKSSQENINTLQRMQKNDKFDLEKFRNKDDTSGVIVFETDVELEPDVVYRCYEDRWLLELVFKTYKNDQCLDKTREQGDFSVYGSEFINFISTLITCRMINKLREVKLLDDHSFGEIMDDLSSAWRKVGCPDEPKRNDGYWVHTLEYVYDEMELLGLCTPLPKPEPKKRGRPRKEPLVPKVKRPRGRPRKIQVPQ